MKRNRLAILFCLSALVTVHISCSSSRKLNDDRLSAVEEQYGWKLGAQAYTFKNFTFSEALEKADSAKLKYIEAFTRQQIGNGIDGIMHFSMNRETRDKVKKMLDDKGIRMFGYGVVKAKGLEEWKTVFEFCKYMGVQTITCEPEMGELEIVSNLCDEYQINAAIHNHPEPSMYWNPDTVLAVLKGKSKRLGACADIGHWVRSGLDPLQCLKKLEGHVKHFHFKDLNEKANKKAHDVIWGTGVCNISGVMKEMIAQRFTGMISAEYEYNWENNTGDLIKCIDYFRSELK